MRSHGPSRASGSRGARGGAVRRTGGAAAPSGQRAGRAPDCSAAFPSGAPLRLQASPLPARPRWTLRIGACSKAPDPFPLRHEPASGAAATRFRQIREPGCALCDAPTEDGRAPTPLQRAKTPCARLRPSRTFARDCFFGPKANRPPASRACARAGSRTGRLRSGPHRAARDPAVFSARGNAQPRATRAEKGAERCRGRGEVRSIGSGTRLCYNFSGPQPASGRVRASSAFPSPSEQRGEGSRAAALRAAPAGQPTEPNGAQAP